MAAERVPGKRSRARGPVAVEEGVGQRLREERGRHDMSLRELARRLGVSPSALSQIERGRSMPSLTTLHAITTELGLSVDELIGAPGATTDTQSRSRRRPAEAPAAEPGAREQRPNPVQRRDERKTLDLDSGVRWERLTPGSDPDLELLYVVYEVGGSSSKTRTFERHMGREFGFVLSGKLRVALGFEELYELGAGDSIAFDSTEPHFIENAGDEPVTAVWLTVDRTEGDATTWSLGGAAAPMPAIDRSRSSP
jgi:transcriptional regulator with XRE-family HTH domain